MNTNFDFNTAEKQSSFELIPAGTIVPICMTLKPGGTGDGGWMKESKTGSIMLDCEFTVTEGEFAKRKFWQFMIVEGNEKAANISRKTLRAIIEASKGIDPNDMSQDAINGRKITGWQEFNGLAFPVKVGIEKAKPESGYSDKNKILVVITPEMPEYQKVTPPVNGSGAGYTPNNGGGYAPKAQMQTNLPPSSGGVTPNWLRKPAAVTA